MRKLMTVCLCLSMLLGIVGCESDKEVEVKKKEYVLANDIDNVYSSPDDYIGKYIKLTGRFFLSVSEIEEGYEFQMWQNFKNDTNNTLIRIDENPNLEDNDYIFVEGEIIGTKTGKNVAGVERTIPIIQAKTFEHGDYITVLAPTLKEVVFHDISLSQNKVTMSVNKIEYAENETRVYLKIINNQDTYFKFSINYVKLIQGSKQYKCESNLHTDYPKLKKFMLPGTTEEGIITFPKITEDNFEIVASGKSPNYEFDDFVFDIRVK